MKAKIRRFVFYSIKNHFYLQKSLFSLENTNIHLFFFDQGIRCAMIVCIPKLPPFFSIIFLFVIERQIYLNGKFHERKAIFTLQCNVKIGESVILPRSLQNPVL